MTPRRYSDAAAIWAGACNPSGIAHSIVNACREAREANADLKTDPAIQLMVAQLAYVTGVWDGISDMKIDLIRVSAECDRLNAATKAASAMPLPLTTTTRLWPAPIATGPASAPISTRSEIWVRASAPANPCPRASVPHAAHSAT